MIWRTRMFKSISAFIIVFFICQSLYSREWEKGIKALSTGMTITEVNAVLSKADSSFKASEKYSTFNHYFFPIFQKFDYPMYYNDDNLSIHHNSVSGTNYVQGKVELKKVFGYRIGMTKWMDGSLVNRLSNPYKSYLKELNKIESHIFEEEYLNKIQSKEDRNFFRSQFTLKEKFYTRNPVSNIEDKKRLIQIIKTIQYNAALFYQYKVFPIYKLNKTLLDAELSFYDQRLFKIVYKVQFDSNKDKDFFDKHLNSTYDKVFRNGKKVGYRLNENVTLTQEIISNQKRIYLLIYTDLPLEARYRDYMKNSRNEVKKAINNKKYSELKEF